MLMWMTGCLTFSREVQGEKIAFQLTQVRVAFVGDDDVHRIIIVILGFGGSSVFEVFCRTDRCCGKSLIGDVRVLQFIRVWTVPSVT